MCFDGMSPCRDSGQIPDRTEMTGCARNGHFHRTRASQRAQLENIIPKALREEILRSAVESANSDTKEAANWGTPNEFATISRFAVNWRTVGRLFPRCWRLEWAAPVQPLAPRCWGRFSPAHAKMKRPPTEAASRHSRFPDRESRNIRGVAHASLSDLDFSSWRPSRLSDRSGHRGRTSAILARRPSSSS